MSQKKHVVIKKIWGCLLERMKNCTQPLYSVKCFFLCQNSFSADVWKCVVPCLVRFNVYRSKISEPIRVKHLINPALKSHSVSKIISFYRIFKATRWYSNEVHRLIDEPKCANTIPTLKSLWKSWNTPRLPKNSVIHFMPVHRLLYIH